jgi:hypothetical protein
MSTLVFHAPTSSRSYVAVSRAVAVAAAVLALVLAGFALAFVLRTSTSVPVHSEQPTATTPAAR